MAKIEDLIARIPDAGLRIAIGNEVRELKKAKKFGLVFENHLPETVQLPNLPVRVGETVARKRDSGEILWIVKSIQKGVATLRPMIEAPTQNEMPVDVGIDELVVVRRFGDPIYPTLVSVDRVNRGGPQKPWHTLIKADNFHALQLLLFCYPSSVDVIYIDPPYNSGARDWKYNNDYVDKTDTFRHSKWLSMMKKRLLIAKHLLKPDGVLIVTIDENELHHLGLLLEDVFESYLRHTVTIVINPKGAGKRNFARTEEHALFCVPKTGQAIVNANMLRDLSRVGLSTEMVQEEFDEELDDEPAELADETSDDGSLFEQQLSDDVGLDELPFPPDELDQWELRHARRRGNESSYRHQRKNQFYPIYIDEKRRVVEEIGEPLLPLEAQPSFKKKNGLTPVWPIDKEGNHRCWRFIASSMKKIHEEKRLVVGRQDPTTKGWTLNYWIPKSKTKNVKTVWWHARHDAGTHGTSMLHKILGRRDAFPFPKSLYATRDALLTVIGSRPNALVLDFFAGSGTTLHATALLNAQLGGSRRCILVSNNEPGATVAGKLRRKQIYPGDADYEAAGICESVTWPRCKFVINGKRDDGTELAGTYLDIEGHEKNLRWSDGFEENIEYFNLDFLEPDEVARGDAFRSILPILWLIAGASGEREDSKGTSAWHLPARSPYAVLIREKEFLHFKERLAGRSDVDWVFLVTDSEENFALMRRALGKKYKCYQLYKQYLENFRINVAEVLMD
ncbi:putative Site-specific DNA-methyltransferase (adenine-specific) [Bradyrhizobium sp. ORS 278]|uniref:site-specific DNA-methyltransferase n=1 Tax=Bradyrhizobium sp. (strain ORS 278) TaxID=114615 RepID=UPI00015076A1|nr:DNA methyltransferase [Bradyrhizobium sp. ORS 278]CAL75269.1 putative Site-specific DNA-methyltransferase (adenine-specific) [Bradyrhizobium sp. ORS 278]